MHRIMSLFFSSPHQPFNSGMVTRHARSSARSVGWYCRACRNVMTLVRKGNQSKHARLIIPRQTWSLHTVFCRVSNSVALQNKARFRRSRQLERLGKYLVGLRGAHHQPTGGSRIRFLDHCLVGERSGTATCSRPHWPSSRKRSPLSPAA